MAGTARRRTSASWSLVRPPWMSVEIGIRGRSISRIHDGSPVMCTSEHRSAGPLTSSRAAAMAASSSRNGAPACGLRAPATVTGLALHVGDDGAPEVGAGLELVEDAVELGQRPGARDVG